MQTQCPHCATVHPIASEQFLQAGGRVRCGVCDREFDALERLRHDPPDEVEVPRLDAELAARQGDLFASPPALGGGAGALPSFVRPRPALQLGSDGLWWLGCAGLLLLLALQIVLAERHRLGTDPAWRGPLETLCATLGCRMPAWREPQAYTLLSREVGPHPSAPEALLVVASLRNDARWAQPLPLVELTLTDIDGKVMAMRRFTPAEYHGGSAGLLAPGQTAHLQLELADPDRRALAFAFEFR
jgi:predicted Zn finger-like uncharacterized protein